MPEEEIERVVSARAPVPEAPELWPENEPYLTAFIDLSGSRAMGFGIGPIPVTEIGAYWDRCGVDDFETFLRRIRAADDAFLKAQREQRKR